MVARALDDRSEIGARARVGTVVLRTAQGQKSDFSPCLVHSFVAGWMHLEVAWRHVCDTTRA